MPDQMEEVKGYYDFILPLILEAGKELVNAKNVVPEFSKIGEVLDLVTLYDRKIEDVLTKKIKETYPSHKHICEEESKKSKSKPKLTDDPTWIIDPIDGTANFVRSMPITCISVGLVINKIQVMGVVYIPYMDELFTAFKGQGAFLNGKRIFTSRCKEIQQSIMNYEITVARQSDYYYKLYTFRFKHLIRIIQGFRSFGCAVVALCYVACGRTDAYQCDGLFPWDAAAGTLIVTEAGGHVTDTLGKEFDFMNPNFLATATKELSDQYMEVERKADEERINLAKESEATKT